MPAMTNILVKDDAATPKEWTFLPVTDADGKPQWRANDPAVALEGQPRFRFSVETLKNGDLKLTAKLEVPVMETLGASGTAAGYVAPQKVAHVVTSIFTMFCSKRSTVSDRANALKMMVGFLQGASSTSGTGVMTNGAAGDVWKNSQLVMLQAFTTVLVPN